MNDESMSSYNRTLDAGNIPGPKFDVVFYYDTNLENCNTTKPQQIIVDNLSGINGSTVNKGLNVVAKVINIFTNYLNIFLFSVKEFGLQVQIPHPHEYLRFKLILRAVLRKCFRLHGYNWSHRGIVWS